MKKLLLRLAAGVLAALLLTGVVALTDNTSRGTRTDGLYYQVTGIHPDAILLTVNGIPITAEEYLYCLAYDCEYLSSYVGDINWSDTLKDDMTYGEYAKLDALETVKQFAVIRSWAEKAGVTLSEKSQQALDAQDKQYTSYYGGEDAFAQQIAYQGVSKECYDSIAAMGYLYADLHNTFCDPDSTIYPSADALDAYAQENGFISFKALSWSADVDGAKSAAEKAAKKLSNAQDLDAVYMDLAEDLGMDPDGSAVTSTASDLGDTLYNAINKLDIGAVSDVIKANDMYYVVIHCDLNDRDVLSLYFDAQIKDQCAAAVVKYSSRYDNIDTAQFYTDLQAARAAMSDANSQK